MGAAEAWLEALEAWLEAPEAWLKVLQGLEQGLLRPGLAA